MPPVETPVRASDMLAFTPECLEDLDNPPVFMLRAMTWEEKLDYEHMLVAKRATRFTDDNFRDVKREELKRLWSPEVYASEIAKLEEYWEAEDNFVLASKDDPELTFDYPAESIEAVKKLDRRLFEVSDKLSDMRAANHKAKQLAPLVLVASVVESFTGLECKQQRVGGYLTLNCVHEISVELAKIEKAAEKEVGFGFVQLMNATLKRIYLDKEEEKNSVSPSQQEPDQKNSMETSGPSTSPASAKSPAKTSSK